MVVVNGRIMMRVSGETNTVAGSINILSHCGEI